MKYDPTDDQDKDAAPVLILGCGDVGRRVARRWLAQGRRVIGLVRSQDSAERLSEMGVEPLRGNLDDPATLARLPFVGSLLYHLVPPQPNGAIDRRTRTLIEQLHRQPPARLVYLGTSGVYGDQCGDWVDESAPTAPATDRARRRLDAEKQLRAFGREHNVPVSLMRVGGIYGDGRLPVARLERGDPILREEEAGYTNRIHAEDLATVAVALGERGQADAIYNVSDNQPGNMSQYFKAVAAAVGLPAPPEIGMAEARRRLSPAMLSYLTESRRLRSTRIIDELGIQLTYPDLDSGLAQAVAALQNEIN